MLPFRPMYLHHYGQNHREFILIFIEITNKYMLDTKMNETHCEIARLLTVLNGMIFLLIGDGGLIIILESKSKSPVITNNLTKNYIKFIYTTPRPKHLISLTIFAGR